VSKHYPVLLKEIISIITPQYGGTLLTAPLDKVDIQKKF
jgi:hypothetical protein